MPNTFKQTPRNEKYVTLLIHDLIIKTLSFFFITRKQNSRKK